MFYNAKEKKKEEFLKLKKKEYIPHSSFMMYDCWIIFNTAYMIVCW